MLLGTLIVGALVAVSEQAARGEYQRTSRWWWRALGRVATVAGGLGVAYALVHAVALVRVSHALTLVHLLLGILATLWGVLAGALMIAREGRRFRWERAVAVVAVVFALTYATVSWANIRIIDADILYKRGLQAERSQAWDRAASLYYEAHVTAPEEDYYLLFLGRTLLQWANGVTDAESRDALFVEALAWLTEARRLNPLNPDHTANLARLYRNWAADDPDPVSADAKLQESLSLYAEVTDLSPNSAQLYNEWGLTYSDRGDLDAALDKYEQSLAIDSQYLDTYLLVGELYYTAGDWAGALTAYDSALQVNENSAAVWASKGSCHANLGEWDEAADAYRRSLEIDAESHTVWAYLGDVYSRTGQMAEALACYKQAVTLYPGYERAIRAWADHAIYLESWADAAEALVQLTQMLPEDYEANYELALAYVKMGRVNEAVTYAERALTLASSGAQRDEAQRVLSMTEQSRTGDTF